MIIEEDRWVYRFYFTDSYDEKKKLRGTPSQFFCIKLIYVISLRDYKSLTQRGTKQAESTMKL